MNLLGGLGQPLSPSFPTLCRGVIFVVFALLMASCASKKDDTVGLTPNPQEQVQPTSSSAGSLGSAKLRPSSQVTTDGIWYTAVPVSGPFIAMTFDDGPHPEHTPRLLDILKERNIKATFYVVGKNVILYPEIMRRMVAEGHEIGNHTWNHPSLTKVSVERMDDELKRTHQAIVDTCGQRPATLRPPYGAFNKSLADYTYRNYGYRTIMWDVDPRDWADRNAGVVTSRILSNTRSGSIVLAHDIHKTTIDAMPATLDRLTEAGYRFVTVSQLIGMEGKRLASTSPTVAATATASTVSSGNPTPMPFDKVYREDNTMPVADYNDAASSGGNPNFQQVGY